MKPVRVAFLSEHASPLALRGSVDAGGQNVYVDEVARNLGALGLQVDIFVRRDDPNLPEIVSLCQGVRVVQVGAGPARWIFKDELWPFMPEFRKGILRFEKANLPYQLLHGNFWMSGWVGLGLRGEMGGIPLVQIFHAMGLTKRRHQGKADTSPEVRTEIERQVVMGADRLIAQCPSEERELIDDYRADPGRIKVIPSGVNIDLYHPVPKSEARAGIGYASLRGPLVGYIGRMLPRKDVRNLVRAFALIAPEFPEARLLLVGGETTDPDPQRTPEIGVLQQLAAELGIAERLIFTGKRQPSELSNYYSAADVVVTTPWYEPFGLTPLEAMACGRPVVGSAVGGITFTVKDGQTGFLVPPRSPESLAARLRLLLGEPELRRRMGDAARQRVEQEFTWRVVAMRTAELYREVLAEHAGVEVEHAVA